MDTVQQNTLAGKVDAGSLRSARLPSFILMLAIIVWLVEHFRRAQTASLWHRVSRLIRQLLPEVLVLILLSGLIVWRLASHVEQGLDTDEAWQDVQHEWPILMTADTLLGLQAMLRFVLVLSASFRHTSSAMCPFEGEPAVFFLFASLTRMLLLALSPREVYHLDGPLGGTTYVAFEAVACVLLLPFGWRMVRSCSRQLIVLPILILGQIFIASRNHFSLAGPDLRHLDILFSLVMLLEMWAGITFLYRSSHSGTCESAEAFSSFAHIILPIQQSLPTYFLLVAFAPPFHSEPSLVGQGRPFELLQSVGLAQVAMFLIAAYLYFVPVSIDKDLHAVSTRIPASEVPPSDDCVICLGSCEECGLQKPCWRRLQCGHHFHEACISQWVKKSKRCPVCRRDVNDKNISPWQGFQHADMEI